MRTIWSSGRDDPLLGNWLTVFEFQFESLTAFLEMASRVVCLAGLSLGLGVLIV